MNVTEALLELVNFKTQSDNSFYTRLSPDHNFYLLYMANMHKVFVCYDINEPIPEDKNHVESLQKHFFVINGRFQAIAAKQL